MDDPLCPSAYGFKQQLNVTELGTAQGETTVTPHCGASLFAIGKQSEDIGPPSEALPPNRAQ
jgi:hypothetical protein